MCASVPLQHLIAHAVGKTCRRMTSLLPGCLMQVPLFQIFLSSYFNPSHKIPAGLLGQKAGTDLQAADSMVLPQNC